MERAGPKRGKKKNSCYAKKGVAGKSVSPPRRNGGGRRFIKWDDWGPGSKIDWEELNIVGAGR